MEEDLFEVSGTICLAGVFFGIVFYACQWGPFRRLSLQLFESNSKLSKEDLDDIAVRMANRVMGTLHNIIQVPFAFLVMRDPKVSGDRMYGATQTSRLFCCITAGYFLVDLFICMGQHHEGPLFFVHAAFAFTLYAHGSFTGFMHFYGAAFIMWEISTFFVHMRWVLLKMGKENSKMYIINGVSMIVAFFGVRVLFGNYMSFMVWGDTMGELKRPSPNGTSPTIIWIYLAANICLSLLNTYWFSLMIRKAVGLLFAKKQGTPSHQKQQ
ncbi:hypothetical protein BSKO_03749 [Bryopsis sp. KO-2023]|nr:hypothetical protein BSKO_03749 [Bryopsis sp. KO-2023]